MEKYKFTFNELREQGWDGSINTLEAFYERINKALDMGWNPKEISLDDFLTYGSLRMKTILKNQNTQSEGIKEPSNNKNNTIIVDDEKSIEERRKRAEEAGWDEEEMDLEEFEDYFM